MKLKVELFDNLLIQGGFDPEAEETEISFASQNIIELTPDQVQGRGTTKMWTVSEVRDWDRTNLGVELPEDDELEAEKELQMTIAKNSQDIKDKVKKEHNNKFNEIHKNTKKKEKICKMCRESQHAFCSKRGCTCQ